MHRSGTSCLTGCLQDCGLHLGEVVTNNWDNLKGNRESLELRGINDAVLEFSGGSWNTPPKRVLWNDSLSRTRDEAIAARSDFKTWGFKDPRTLLTLPFWLEALPDIRLVGTFRRPSGVVYSLSRRNGISATSALSLWSDYNEKLLMYVSEYDLPLVCFDWQSDQYTKAVFGVARSLGLKNAHSSGSLSFFDDELRTEQASPTCTVSSPQADALYEALISRCVTVENNRNVWEFLRGIWRGK
jgi:hypothetical protein